MNQPGQPGILSDLCRFLAVYGLGLLVSFAVIVVCVTLDVSRFTIGYFCGSISTVTTLIWLKGEKR